MLGYYAAIGESLLQCYDNHLILLPSLIEDWKKGGGVYGLAAYGGVTADLSWENGEITALTLRANSDRELVVETTKLPVQSSVAIQEIQGGFSVSIKKGETLSFTF
jgi:alpha-L-fucosidase 2